MSRSINSVKILNAALVSLLLFFSQASHAQEIKEVTIVSFKEATAVGIKTCAGTVGNLNDSAQCFGVLLKEVNAKDLLGNTFTGDVVIMGATQYGATNAAANITLAFHALTVGDMQRIQSAQQWVSKASVSQLKVITPAIPLSSLTGVAATAENPDRQVMLGGITIYSTNWRVENGYVASQDNTLTLGVE